jgi:arsenite methyltransferase
MKSPQRPNYGIDAPRMGFTILLVVLLAALAGYILRMGTSELARAVSGIIFSLLPTGILLLLLIVLYVTREKFRHRDRILNMVSWKGNEQVLDIGTGKGLLMIGAAKRLTTGKSVGIDIWNRNDLSNNSVASAMRNAKLEQVQDKVEIKNADARQIPFADQTFDYVLSNLCLHNIDAPEGRQSACREIVRVLKPGGTALVADFMHTKEYAATFRLLGLEVHRSYSLLIAPVMLFIVKAKKK